MLSPTFTSGKLKSMLEPLVQVSDKTIEHLEEQVKQKPILDIKPLVQGFSLDAIGKKYDALEKYDYFC